MMFMGLLSVILFVLAIAIFKNVVEGGDCKAELITEGILILIFFITYILVFG